MNIFTTFPLGRLVATKAVLDSVAMTELGASLQRHASRDWGDVEAEDSKLNDAALISGGRILSAYKSSKGIRFWIITERDRSASVILLPEEY